MELSLCPLSEVGWSGRVRARGDANFDQEDTEITNSRDDTRAGTVLRVGEIRNIVRVLMMES